MLSGDKANKEEEGEHLRWRALADPTRRRILDLLRDRPQTTGEIAAAFPVSRIAVMRHFDVLAEAGLVVSHKRGRQRWHYANLAPIMRLHERWSTPVPETLASGLLRLKDQMEEPMAGDVSTLDVALEVSINADADAVYRALTEAPGAWWGHPYLRPEATSLSLEARLGAPLMERWDGGGLIMATITGLVEGRWLQLTGPLHLGVANGVTEFDLTPTDAGTTVAMTFRAFGLIDPQMVEGFNNAWRELVTVRLKAFVEDGTRLGIDGD